MAIPENIEQLANDVRTKVYGREVREALASGIEAAGSVANDADVRSQETETRQTDLETRFEQQIQNMTLEDPSSAEIVDARGGETVLKNRLDKTDQEIKKNHQDVTTQLARVTSNLPRSQDMTGDINYVDGGLNGIRSIFDEPIRNFNSKLSMIPINNCNIGVITDIHYDREGIYWNKNIGDGKTGITHLYNLAYFSERLDAVVLNGDNVDSNNADVNVSMAANKAIATTALTLMDCPTFILKGNHDDNSVNGGQDGTVVLDKDFRHIYRQNINLFGEVRDDESNYFYYDITDKKLRVIGLDSYDTDETFVNGQITQRRIWNSAFSEKQIKWLINNALLLPSNDYHVIILTHCSLQGVFYDNPTEETCTNHDKVLQVIEAFKNGGCGTLSLDGNCVSYNFEPSNLIGVVYGHHHEDNFKTLNNVNHIIVRNSLGKDFPVDGGTEYYNTENEDSWKVFSIDTNTRKCSVLSFGRGDDREFTY